MCTSPGGGGFGPPRKALFGPSATPKGGVGGDPDPGNGSRATKSSWIDHHGTRIQVGPAKIVIFDMRFHKIHQKNDENERDEVL